jgi:low temperature requirement protein LtrA
MGEPGRERRVPEDAGWKRATFLELFFDLVFVYALNQFSVRLIHDFSTGGQLRWGEVVATVLLFLAFWQLWVSTVALTSRLNPDSPPLQIIVFMSMAGAAVMAVAVTQGFEGRALVFAGAYVAVRIGRLAPFPIFHLRFSIPVTLAIFLSAVPWIMGALVDDKGLRAVLWSLALAIDFGGFALGIQPWARGQIAGEHLAERLQQLFLIALGETIFVSSRAFTNSDFGLPDAAGFGLAFASTLLFWRIYFYRAGTVLPRAITGARNPVRESRAVSGVHLLMIAGVVLAGVGFELYITRPLAHPHPQWLIAILGGPALFLIGRALLRVEVLGRVSRARLASLLALAPVTPALWYAPPLAAGGAVAVVLAAIAGSYAWTTRGRAPEQPTPAF